MRLSPPDLFLIGDAGISGDFVREVRAPLDSKLECGKERIETELGTDRPFRGSDTLSLGNR
jgi:hypothetical protein